jgi:hypothetical protein
MRGTSVAMFLALLCLPPSVHAQPVAVESLPPVVVRTVPQSGDLAVDPTLKEISVTFSKDMTTVEMWSWAEITPDSFPKLAGKPHYLGDRRTCVLPVKLEPGKTYAIWVNSARYDNFRDQGNRPAVPYLLVFRTRT